MDLFKFPQCLFLFPQQTLSLSCSWRFFLCRSTLVCSWKFCTRLRIAPEIFSTHLYHFNFLLPTCTVSFCRYKYIPWDFSLKHTVYKCPLYPGINFVILAPSTRSDESNPFFPWLRLCHCLFLFFFSVPPSFRVLISWYLPNCSPAYWITFLGRYTCLFENFYIDTLSSV